PTLACGPPLPGRRCRGSAGPPATAAAARAPGRPASRATGLIRGAIGLRGRSRGPPSFGRVRGQDPLGDIVDQSGVDVSGPVVFGQRARALASDTQMVERGVVLERRVRAV